MNTCKRCGLVIADTAMGTTVPQCKCHWRSQEKIVLSREITDTTEQFLHNDLAEYKQRAEAAEAKLRELEMQEPQMPAITICFGSQGEILDYELNAVVFSPKDFDAFGTKEIDFYAKPFPAPKQEEK